MLQLLLFLLPLAAISGWLSGYRHRKSMELEKDNSPLIPPDYFVGLNYLINEQPDKAVDVFIKMVEVNTDTVETHLALGNLFRRRGEVDRAIRVHQNLIARPQLKQKQKLQALFELAQDYLRAGVLDRAERLFLELIEIGDKADSLNNLINIYQQQKDWQQAIVTAKKLESLSNDSMNNAIAHYYCELAEQARLSDGHYEYARAYLKEALKHDKNCARANIILGQLFFEASEYQSAINTLRMVCAQDAEYVSEVINLLAESYRRIGQESEFVNYLSKNIAEKPRIYYILAMTDYLRDKQGDMIAIEYLSNQMSRCLSLRGLERMLGLYINHVDINIRNQLSLLREFTEKLIETKPIYRCIHCGFSGKNLYWQCPSCKKWNSVKPIHGLEGD